MTLIDPNKPDEHDKFGGPNKPRDSNETPPKE
jgi:hypothetical protein